MMFLKELILIKQLHQNSVIFVTIGIFYINRLSLYQISPNVSCSTNDVYKN